MSPPTHTAGYCSVCESHHQVVESIPDRPLRLSEVESFDEKESVRAALPVLTVSGTVFGMDDEDVTEDLVFTTDTKTRLLSRYHGAGWSIEREIEHDEDDTPEEVASELFSGASDVAESALNNTEWRDFGTLGI